MLLYKVQYLQCLVFRYYINLFLYAIVVAWHWILVLSTCFMKYTLYSLYVMLSVFLAIFEVVLCKYLGICVVTMVQLSYKVMSTYEILACYARVCCKHRTIFTVRLVNVCCKDSIWLCGNVCISIIYLACSLTSIHVNRNQMNH